jgi:hypothetical protein
VIQALTIDLVTRSYLASNQLTAVVNYSEPHLEATVATTMTAERRQFSWLWQGDEDGRALLVNRMTGTLFDPDSGQAVNASPRLLEAPFPVPHIVPGKRLPVGQFSTAQV